MLQFLSPDSRFRMLIDEVSRQIQHTDFSDAKIAEACFTSREFVRRQRKFLKLCPDGVCFKEVEMPKKIPISREDLHREYVENEKTLAECAEFFGCSVGVIMNRMEEYEIPTRSRGGFRKKSETTLEEITTPDTETELLETKLKEPFEVIEERKRMLERLVLLSIFTEMSIQELLEEALEILFEKYAKDV